MYYVKRNERKRKSGDGFYPTRPYPPPSNHGYTVKPVVTEDLTPLTLEWNDIDRAFDWSAGSATINIPVGDAGWFCNGVVTIVFKSSNFTVTGGVLIGFAPWEDTYRFVLDPGQYQAAADQVYKVYFLRDGDDCRVIVKEGDATITADIVLSRVFDKKLTAFQISIPSITWNVAGEENRWRFLVNVRFGRYVAD
jgi:hypothetical protein